MLMTYLSIVGIINFIGFYLYGGWSIKGVAHRTQMVVDFLCPIGCIIGRLLFKFDMKTNRFAYVYGLILEILLSIIYFIIF